MKSEVRGQILSGCAVRAALQQGPSLRDALRTIYEDIPARPNMTEAGRVAMMAETARAALESDSHETGEWRSMDTAPMDGTEVLLCIPNGGDPTRGFHRLVGRWHEGAWTREVDYEWGETWPPAGWIPLPAPLAHAQKAKLGETFPDTLVRWVSSDTWRCHCKGPGAINHSIVGVCTDCGTLRPEKAAPRRTEKCFPDCVDDCVCDRYPEVPAQSEGVE